MRDLPGFDRLALLKSSPVLSCLKDRQLGRLSQFSVVRSFAAGERIFEKGDQAGSLFAVASGSVEISVRSEEGRRIILRHIRPGEVFGEIGMLDNLPRTADAIAHEINIGGRDPAPRFLFCYGERTVRVPACHRTVVRSLAAHNPAGRG